MAEYIEREILISALESEFEDNENCRLFVSEIPKADVVEVVRCGQCGNYCKNTGECNLYGRHPNENDFCSSGIKEREGVMSYNNLELMPCPQCGETPILGYACGEYFIMPLSKPVGVCFCGCFDEMHSSEEYQAKVWNQAVQNEMKRSGNNG